MVHWLLSWFSRVYLHQLYFLSWCMLRDLNTWLQALICTRFETHVVNFWRHFQWYLILLVQCLTRESACSILRISGWYMCFHIETLLINRFNYASNKWTWIMDFALSEKSKINLLDGFELAFLFCTIFVTLTSEQREESFFSLFESFFLSFILF